MAMGAFIECTDDQSDANPPKEHVNEPRWQALPRGPFHAIGCAEDLRYINVYCKTYTPIVAMVNNVMCFKDLT
jgi:hypothetical protein